MQISGTHKFLMKSKFMQIKDCLIQELCKSKFVNGYYDLTGCESECGMPGRVVLLSLELQELSSLPLWLLRVCFEF